jgi:hypothetical protein
MECCFFHIIYVNMNLVVIGPKIELHEEPGAMEFIEELLHNRILGIYL